MIKLEDLSFKYKGEQEFTLKNINLEINPGEVILLCGKSGSGKTTLTRVINGLIPHFYLGKLEGCASVDKMDIKKTPMYKISEKVGSVFQNPRTQFFNIDTDSEIAFGVENLSYPLSTLQHSVKKTIVDLNIEHLMGRNIFKLSGGEKQKIAFASIYAISPDIYVLDEPSANLDIDAIADLKKILILLKQQKKTIIIAEHRIFYLMDIIDRVFYLDGGKITKIYSQENFISLSNKEKRNLGLRPISLMNVNQAQENPLKMQPLLEIKNVSIFYRKYKVLEDLNLTAYEKDIIGVIGKNGVGKSTLVRTLCGLHKGYKGKIFWKGKEMSKRKRLKISYLVFQDVNYQLFAESVNRECIFGIKKPDKDLAAQTLKDLDLYEYRHYHPYTLSGGQKQRLAVAISMICNREILIFDEPSSGLDLRTLEKVADLIRKLSKMGKLIFLVTHDYELISSICNRIIHLDQGVIKNDSGIKEERKRILNEYYVQNFNRT
jgi:energy-coupling factor transport system ATP-binding protein